MDINKREQIKKHAKRRRVLVSLNEYEYRRVLDIKATTGESKAAILKRIFNTYVSSSMTFKSE